MATLLSVQIGTPRTLGDRGASDHFDREWTTAIFKEPVVGPVRLTELGLEGDGQADRSVHGGPDKALCAYSADHYPFWRDELGRDDFSFGAFGENVTVEGLDERTICLGDVYRLGTVVLQVSQPRTPCGKLARKWRSRTLAARVVETGFSGWYFRVLEPGEIEPGLTFELVERPHPDWPLTRANEVMHHRKLDGTAAAALAAIPELAGSWRETLLRRV